MTCAAEQPPQPLSTLRTATAPRPLPVSGASSNPGWQRPRQKSRRPLYLQLRSMVPQIRTAAFGLNRRCRQVISLGTKELSLRTHPSRRSKGRCAMKKRDGRNIGADSAQGLKSTISKRLCCSAFIRDGALTASHPIVVACLRYYRSAIRRGTFVFISCLK